MTTEEKELEKSVREMDQQVQTIRAEMRRLQARLDVLRERRRAASAGPVALSQSVDFSLKM